MTTAPPMGLTTQTPPPKPHAPTPAAGPLRWKWTRADLIRLDELGFFRGQRVMLIDGDVLAMSPMNEPHARAIVFSDEVLRAAFGPGFTFRTQMPMDLGQTTDPGPDIAVISGPVRAQPPTPPTTAALIVEVADSSLAYDTGEKAGLYAAAGVADNWVLDVVNRRLHVFRDPRPDPARRFGWGYFQQLMHGPADRVAPLAAPNHPVTVGDLLP